MAASSKMYLNHNSEEWKSGGTWNKINGIWYPAVILYTKSDGKWFASKGKAAEPYDLTKTAKGSDFTGDVSISFENISLAPINDTWEGQIKNKT